MTIRGIIYRFLVILNDYILLIYSYLLKKNAIKKNNGICIVRLDAIGDYVLFRNFIDELYKSDIFCNKKITLIGNEAFNEVAELFDKKYIDCFIWINRKRFYKNLIYRNKILLFIQQLNFEVIIQPTYSREFFYTESIIHFANAKYKVGRVGGIENISVFGKYIANTYYDKLFDEKKDVHFEFYKNRDFFERLLDHKLDTKFSMVCNEQNFMNTLAKYGINGKRFGVLFIGASAQNRKWDIKNFLQIGEFLTASYGLCVIICGIDADNSVFIESSVSKNHKLINLVGKTNLIELIYLLSKSSITISNDTSVQHFAVALGSPVLVISQGNHFGRFNYYPSDIVTSDKYQCVYHSEIESNMNEFDLLVEKFAISSKLSINDISVDVVKNRILNCFDLTKNME